MVTDTVALLIAALAAVIAGAGLRQNTLTDLEEIRVAMIEVEGVNSVHDLHVWSLSAERVALSAHVVTSTLESWPDTLERLRAMLAERYAIEHVTLQPELAAAAPTSACRERLQDHCVRKKARQPAIHADNCRINPARMAIEKN